MDAFNCILKIFNFYLKPSHWALPYSSSKQRRLLGLAFDTGPGFVEIHESYKISPLLNISTVLRLPAAHVSNQTRPYFPKNYAVIKDAD